MAIKDQLMEELKLAMKEKDDVRKSTITMLRAAIKQIEIDQRIELDDEAILEIIIKQMKQKSAAREEFEKGGRPDLVEQTVEEMAILQKYLPEPMTGEEIQAVIDAAVAETGATGPKDMGKVMPLVNAGTKGRADGKKVAELVKAALAGK